MDTAAVRTPSQKAFTVGEIGNIPQFGNRIPSKKSSGTPGFS